MSKKILPQYGVPAIDFLTKLAEEAAQRPNAHPLDSDFPASLIPIINSDACLSPNQQEYLKLLFKAAATKVAEGENYDIWRLPLATYINSTRLDCAKCLNRTCNMRGNE